MIPEFIGNLLFLEVLILLEPDDLGSACFPCNCNIFQPGRLTGPTLSIDGLNQPFADQFHISSLPDETFNHLRFKLFDHFAVRIPDVLNKPRFVERPAICQHRRHQADLYGCCKVKSLANGDRQGFSFLPRGIVTPFFPGGSRNKAVFLVLDINTCFAAESHPDSITCQPVNTEPLPNLVEVNVT